MAPRRSLRLQSQREREIQSSRVLTLFTFPREVRDMIYEYALEEFSSAEGRVICTLNMHRCHLKGPHFRSGSKLRLQSTGLLAGLGCNNVLYFEALSVYHERTMFKVNLLNWQLVSSFVSIKTFSSIRHLLIQFYDGHVFEKSGCGTFWGINSSFERLLTSRAQKFSFATILETLTIEGDGFRHASNHIPNIVESFLGIAPKLRQVEVSFPLYERHRDYKVIQAQIDLGLEAERKGDLKNFKYAVPKSKLLDRLNSLLGVQSGVFWGGHALATIGTATWTAQAGRTLAETKALKRTKWESQWEDLDTQHQRTMKEGARLEKLARERWEAHPINSQDVIVLDAGYTDLENRNWADYDRWLHGQGVTN